MTDLPVPETVDEQKAEIVSVLNYMRGRYGTQILMVVCMAYASNLCRKLVTAQVTTAKEVRDLVEDIFKEADRPIYTGPQQSARMN